MKPSSTLPLVQKVIAKPSSSKEVRHKFLRNLGIENEMKHRDIEQVKRAAFSSSRRSSVIYNETLKTGYCPPQSSQNTSKITFNDQVAVVPIPMRDEYSERVKQRLWSNAEEIYHNAARNSVEFAAEGWDWQSVIEDEKMYICSVSGELIHPIHASQMEFS